MEDFKEQVRKSFSACKSDIESLKTENIELRDKLYSTERENRVLTEKISNLTSEIYELKAELKGISVAIEYIKDFNEKIISANSNMINPNMAETAIKTQNIEPINESNFLKSNINPVKAKIEDPYEALLAFKAKANKRDLLKQKILSMIGESGLNLSELKYMFVEHFRYCSKATFYNYLKELELEKSVRIERENSKNHIYLNSMRKEI